MQTVKKIAAMAVLATIGGIAMTVLRTVDLFAAATPGFVYALVDRSGAANQLYGFSLDASGVLSLLPGFPTPTGGNGNGSTFSEELVFDPVRSRLYGVNAGSNTVSAFSVNRATGALTLLPFSPIATPASGQCLAISPSGSVLIIGSSSSSLASFLIGDATATAAPGSPFTGGTSSFSCAFSRDGAFAFAGGLSGSQMASFSVAGTTGVLTAVGGSPFNMGFVNSLGYQTDAQGRLFGVSVGSSRAFVFTTSAGVPTAASNVLLGQITPVHGLLHPNGFYLATGRDSNNVGVFKIAGTGAATTLTAAPGSPFATAGTFSDVSVMDTAGTIVVTANGNSRNLTTFAFNLTTGAMTPTSVQAANTVGATGVIVGLAYAPTPIATSNPPAAPPAPGATPPTITAIADQTIAVSGSATVSFTVGGAIIPPALRVSATSSDSALVPSSALAVTHTASGNDTLRVQAADGRSGTATITVTVSDGAQSASTSFVLYVGVVSGTPGGPTTAVTTPTSLVAAASGSGAVLTWSPPTAGAPTRYVVVGGIRSGGSELGVMMSADASTSFTIPVLPPGTYYFRVYGVTPASLSVASNESSVVAPGLAGAAAPPLYLGAAVDGREVTLRWTPSPFGGASTIDIVEFGSAPGVRDVATVTAVTPVHMRRLDPIMLWARVRATNALGVSGPSMDVQIPVAPAVCTAAPDAPVLLPATIVDRRVGFAWFEPAGTAAATYRVDVTDVAGAVTPLSTSGPGGSVVWTAAAAGTYSARVTALNACGSSAPSAALVVGVQ